MYNDMNNFMCTFLYARKVLALRFSDTDNKPFNVFGIYIL
jgi:hypothetical protein